MASAKVPPRRDPLERTLRVRMLPEDFYRLAQVAARKKKTASDIARDALEAYVVKAERELGIK